MKTTTPPTNPHWNGRRFAARAVRKIPIDTGKLTRAFALYALTQTPATPTDARDESERRPS